MEGVPTVDFISRFNNLEGDTIGERKKNFSELLRQSVLFPNEQQLRDTLKNLQPKSYLESIFKVDALIHFKQTDELMEILKQGNEMFISKILKASWFFEEAFKDMDAQTFVNVVLPCTSYAVRMKLVNTISRFWNEKKMDELYDSLATRYGIYMANIILHKCSARKIQDIWKQNEIKLRPNQVKYLVDRDVELFKMYLDYIKLTANETCSKVYGEAKVLKHLALKNPLLLLDLEKNSKVMCRIMGRRMSRSVVHLVKKDILDNPTPYLKLLNNSVVVRKFGNQFGVIYRQLFPKRFSAIEVDSTCNKLLLLHPKSKRWNLFAQTYTELFSNRTMEEILMKFDNSFLALRPTEEVIMKWANMHYEAEENDDFLKYFKPTEAIKIIKEKINVTAEKSKRRSLVMLLLETCAQHKDLESLVNVLKYIGMRHRNENFTFRELLLRKIPELFELTDFNASHWDCISDQIKLTRMKGGSSFWNYKVLLENYIVFLIKNEKPQYKVFLIDYINDSIAHYSGFDFDVNDCAIKKFILLEVCRLFPKVETMRKDDKLDENHFYMHCSGIFNFSYNNPDHCIRLSELPSFAVSFIENCFSKNQDLCFNGHLLRREVILYHFKFPQNAFLESEILLNAMMNSIMETKSFFDYKDLFKNYVMIKNRTEMADKILTLYLEEAMGLFFWAPVRWLLMNEPRVLIPYFDKVISTEGIAFYDEKLKFFTHFDFDRKACDFYKKKLNQNTCQYKKGYVEKLQELLPTDEFMNLIEEFFLPQKEKIDLDDEETKRNYNLQCEVAGMLHKVQEPYKMLPVVMKFCVGDYLQAALPSLYGVFYKSPENILYEYVKVLETRAMSVRKHAVFLSCELLNRNHLAEALNAAKGSDVSSQKCLFSATLKYFEKNPSQEMLNMIIELMQKIDKNDVETFHSIKKIKMPQRFRTQFIEKSWLIYESLNDDSTKVKQCLEGLLKLMSPDVLKSISSSFIKDLISRYFVCEKKLLGFENFVIDVLKHRISERKENFSMVFEVLSKFKIQSRRSFLTCFFHISSLDGKDKEFIETFNEFWNKHITLLKNFEDHVALNFFLMQLHCNSSQEHAIEIVSYLNRLISEFGLHIFKIFKRQLKVEILKMRDIEEYALFLDILKTECSASTCILVLQLMNHVDQERSDVFEYYSNIINLIRNVSDPTVQIYYESFINAKEYATTSSA